MLTLETNDEQALYWYVDAYFAVHADMKSYTRSVFSFGKVMIVADSTKQKVNARSLTESELIGVDDRISEILWTWKMLERQGFKVKVNIIYQDNTSTTKLQKNGKASSVNRTRHYDIKYCYVTDLTGRGEFQVIYFPTNDMLGDYMNKPLLGSKFGKFIDLIINFPNKYHPVVHQECFGELCKKY